LGIRRRRFSGYTEGGTFNLRDDDWNFVRILRAIHEIRLESRSEELHIIRMSCYE
jgi:hypothetical protein